MIDFKKILAVVKIKNTETWEIFYLQKNFDRYLDEEKNIFLEEKYLTSHSWFFYNKKLEKWEVWSYHRKIFHKKNFYLEENFEIEYLYLNNFFEKNWKFLRTNEKNLEKLKNKFTKEIRSNFFFTEASFFYLTDENFNTISTYRISPKNFHIWLNDFKNTPLKNFFKWSFFIYPFQILEKKFLDYITNKIDFYLWNTETFSKEKFLNPTKNTNYVNFFSQKYEFFAYLKFKEILEEIFLENFELKKEEKNNIKKNFLNLRKRFLLEDSEKIKNFEIKYNNKYFSEKSKKILEKNVLDKKIIRFEDDFWQQDFNKEIKNVEKKYWFLEYQINENLSFKYIFWDKIKKTEKNKSHFLNEDFSQILWKNFRNNSEKLTPDISLEINNEDKNNSQKNFSKKIFFDVKFSSFKDFDLKLDYPNPWYFKSDLHKYRKIWYPKGSENEDFSSKPDKIFLIYPWNITKENFAEFKKMNHLIEKSYNMVLVPIYYGFWEKNFLRKYLKEIFFDEIKSLI